MKNNRIKSGKNYLIDGVECIALIDNGENISLVKDKNDILVFLLGDYEVNDENNIVKTQNKISYSITKKDMFNYIDSRVKNDETLLQKERIASIIREKFYKIPTVFARIIAELYLEWYLFLLYINKSYVYIVFNFI